MSKFIITYRGKGIYYQIKSETGVDAVSEKEAREYFSRFYPSAQLLTIKQAK